MSLAEYPPVGAVTAGRGSWFSVKGDAGAGFSASSNKEAWGWAADLLGMDRLEWDDSEGPRYESREKGTQCGLDARPSRKMGFSRRGLDS